MEAVDLGSRRRGDRAGVDEPRPVDPARRRRDRRAQEQLRRQGQQLRLPRELPARPRAAVRPARRRRSRRTSSPARCSPAPARSAANCPAARTTTSPYQLSQRADFFEEEIGLETTLKRPIVNTRDEPHADAQKYRRLHVIVGDANMSEVATYLKVGTTAIVLAMIEDDALGDEWVLGNPVAGDPPGEPRPVAAPDDHAARRQPGHRAGGAVGPARAGTQVRAVARPGLRRRGGRHRRARTLGAGARRSRSRPVVGRQLGRLGRQAAPRRRLRRSPRPRARRRRSSRRSTCSTTTCVPTAASPRGPASTRSSTPTMRRRR